jgi:hypothetical protein
LFSLFVSISKGNKQSKMSGLDILTVFNGAIELVTLGRGILKIPSHLYNEWMSPKEMQIRKSYGILATYGTKILLNDAWILLHRIETDILPSDDRAILAFKSAYSSDCAMTAVAVSHLTTLLFEFPFLLHRLY